LTLWGPVPIRAWARAVLCGLLGLFSGMSGAFDAINTSVYFPAVVQGHHGTQSSACSGVPNPQLSEVNNPRINGTGGDKLAFCSISFNQNNTKNCDDGQGGYKACAVTGQDIAGLSLTGNNAFPANDSKTDLNCTNNGSAVLSLRAYRYVNSMGCQLTMTDQSGYQITSLNMSNGGTLTLGPGDHFFETLSLDNTTIKLQSHDQALTRIFVKNPPTLRNTFSVNGGGKQNLIWVSYGDFAMDNGNFVGYLYAGGRVTMSNQATLTGRITAKALEVRDNSVINKGDAALPSSTCGGIFTDPPSGGQIMMPPPGILEPPLGDLTCEEKGGVTTCTGTPNNSNVFAPGDHDFNRGYIGNKAALAATGVTARLYFNELTLNNAQINVGGAPENLLIYVKGSLNVVGQVRFNGILYVAGDVRMTGNSELRGAVAAGGSIELGGSNDFEFMQDAVDKVDFGDISCGGSAGGASLDHFELSHSGQALTCNPETVTVKACANVSCSKLVAEQVSATLSPSSSGSNGWVGGNQLAFRGGSTTAQLRNNTVGAVTIGVSSSTPAFVNPTLCRAGGGAPSTAACALNFADSGFLFDVTDTLANKPQQVMMRAVKKDNASQQCVPGFANVSKTIAFSGSYVSPASNAFASKIKVNGQDAMAGSSQSLAFDSQGATQLTVNYPDAGQVQLNVRHDGSGETAGLVMTGADQFVARPVGLCIIPQTTCAAGDASCPLFKKTGEGFSFSIGGAAWQVDNDTDLCSGNLATPNFALANIALGSQLVAPIPGTQASVGTLSYNHVNTASNNLNVVNQSVNEVGVFRLTATPPSGGYFGYTIPAASSVPVGRFVPWDFNLVSGTVTPACGVFSYMNQPFGVKLQVQARNQQGGITQNYRDAFARGTISLVAANNKDGVDRSNRLDPLTTSWQAGVANIDGQNRFARLNAAEDPLRALRLGLKVTDNETPETSFLTNRDMNPAVTGDCQIGVNCTARQLSIPQGSGNTMIAYYGRLLASTRQGVASAPLALPLQAQYFEGGQWRVNQQDFCTQLSLAGGGIEFTDANQHYDAGTGDLVLKDGTRIRLGLGQVAPGGSQASVTAGETRLHFAAPNQSVRIPYRIVLEQQPFAPLWLADPATADHLLGEAIFGASRGNDRIIYRREPMP